MKLNVFSYVILLICLTVVSCEFFSSVHELTKLVDYERFLLGKMEKFVTLNENKLDYLKEKLTEFEKEHEDALKAGEEYFENPINEYLLTKRLSMDWEKLANFLEHEVGTSVLKSIDKFRTNNTFPGEDDFKGAIGGILRLQKVYRLNSRDIAQGILRGVRYMTELSAKDCYDFGNIALENDELLAAHAWLSEALDRFDSYEQTIIDEKLEKPDILELLAETKFKLSDFNGAAELAYALNLWRPNDSRLREWYNYYIQHAYHRASYQVESEHDPIPSDFDTISDFATYQQTCNEQIHQSASLKRDLRCSYVTTTHPFLLLAPIKVEQVHKDPLLLVYHDVIYDSEIEKIIQLANDKMKRAAVLTNNVPTVSSARTSQYVFYRKEVDKVLQTIDQRVADMTGLNMDVAEQHQIANYGIGGHYSAHYDFFHKMEGLTDYHLGNRIATVLFYMTDIEQGGGTAFPRLRVLLKPKKGDAAFWYNLHTSGVGDTRTRHGACPVLVGSKWVLNRWIRERHQDVKRPCNLINDADNI